MRHRMHIAPLLILITSAIVYATPDQPNMQSAKSNLQNAKANLMAAEHDKGGHRAKAINLINSAIAEVNRGINFARQNNHVTIEVSPVPDQPHMEAALKFLESARSDLDRATNDKGGHRANALRLTNEAIDEVKLGIAAGR